jgi:hypothetical protein
MAVTSLMKSPSNAGNSILIGIGLAVLLALVPGTTQAASKDVATLEKEGDRISTQMKQEQARLARLEDYRARLESFKAGKNTRDLLVDIPLPDVPSRGFTSLMSLEELRRKLFSMMHDPEFTRLSRQRILESPQGPAIKQKGEEYLSAVIEAYKLASYADFISRTASKNREIRKAGPDGIEDVRYTLDTLLAQTQVDIHYTRQALDKLSNDLLDVHRALMEEAFRSAEKALDKTAALKAVMDSLLAGDGVAVQPSPATGPSPAGPGGPGGAGNAPALPPIDINLLGTAARAAAPQAPPTEVDSWWASRDEPPLLDTVLSLSNPQTDGRFTTWTLDDIQKAEVHMTFNGQDRRLRKDEAIVFLLARSYVEYATVDGRQQLRTTRKFFAWRDKHPLATAAASQPGRGGTSPSLPFLLGKLPPGQVWDAPAISVAYDPATNVATVNPSHVEITRTDGPYADGTFSKMLVVVDFKDGRIDKFKSSDANGLERLTAAGPCDRFVHRSTTHDPGKRIDITHPGVKWNANFDPAVGGWRLDLLDAGTWTQSARPKD